MNKERYLKFSDEAFDEALEKIFQEIIYNQKPIPQDEPKAIVFGGQPGAGKSSIMMDMENLLLNGNCVIISGDEYRKDHPQFKQIVEHYGDDWSLKTGKWSGKLVEKIIEKAIEQKFNIQVEGTLRDLKVPMGTMQLLKSQGYDITLMIVTCDQNLSWESTVQRYERDMIFGEIPRAVNKDYYDKLIKDLPKNAEDLYNLNLHDRFMVWSRDQNYNRNIAYDSNTNGKFSRNIIERELEPKKEQKQEIKKDGISR
ncbi:MAG: zeta toxin family protein [Sulfurovaceae bacterium]|nr:zeta toxin family protein [Sulfurovaceae bacterium]